MPRVQFTVESDLPPERVMAAATDFSERRPDLWPNISRKYYEVHEQGANFCECTEGTEIMGGIWARERYEWTSDTILGRAVESNVFHPGGTWELRVEPNGTGGSRIHVDNNRRPKGKALLLAPMMAIGGKKLLAGHLQKTLDIVRGETPEGTQATHA
jgi:hypothetical protein